ncbi:phosphate transport system permease protein [Azospirillaceae bacterium]
MNSSTPQKHKRPSRSTARLSNSQQEATSFYQSALFVNRLRRRYAAERRFRRAGMAAIGLALSMLVLLLGSIAIKGYSGFWETQIKLDIVFDAAIIDPTGTRAPETLRQADYQALVRKALQTRFPGVSTREHKRQLIEMISTSGADALRHAVRADSSLIGKREAFWLAARSDIDQLAKGKQSRTAPEADRRVSDQQIAWLDQLNNDGALRQAFNVTLFVSGDSREPEQAGIGGGIIGSMLTLIITLALALPIGIAAAVYLEEFAKKGRFTNLIEVNINNLAAVPSIVFGLLGLAVFLDVFGMPRSAPLVGGVVLALMTLPTIIIAARSAIKATPPSIREAALGLGASPLQVVTHHVLPLSLPGILTGAIIGMSRALGETAPLLLIGMVAFVVDIPKSVFDPATVMPVQIFMWSRSAESAFVERTSAAILILLALLVAMNGLAVVLRRKFERRW